MDPKVLFSAAGLVFLAELGDKTQLMALTLAAKSGKPWSVFIGASLSLVFLTLLAIALGAIIGRVIPGEIIAKMAGATFVVGGVLVFFGRI